MIFLVDEENRYLFEDDLRVMHLHRRKVFVDRLGWELTVSDDGGEYDQYDTDAARYLLIKDAAADRLLGSARLLPTSRPHLMGDHFSHLCAVGVPQGEAIWEVSRYCTDPHIADRNLRLLLLRQIFCGLVESALLFGIEALTFVVGMAIIPYCLECGWNIRPLGLPQKLGHDRIAAFRVEVTPTGLQNVRRYAAADSPLLRYPHGAVRTAA